MSLGYGVTSLENYRLCLKGSLTYVLSDFDCLKHVIWYLSFDAAFDVTNLDSYIDPCSHMTRL